MTAADWWAVALLLGGLAVLFVSDRIVDRRRRRLARFQDRVDRHRLLAEIRRQP